MGNRKHLSRLAMPKTWPLPRKGYKWITKPMPGPHRLNLSMPLNLVLKNLLKYVKILKEAKYILNKGDVVINGKIRKSHKFPVGFMDVIEIPSLDEYYRVLLDRKGRFYALKIKKDEALLKPFKIIGKKILKKGKFQINFYDGTNKLAGKDGYKVGDTLVLDLKKREIKKHLKFDKGSKIFLFEGKYAGSFGVVEEIIKMPRKDSIVVSSGKNKFETLKKYAFVIDDSFSLGEDK